MGLFGNFFDFDGDGQSSLFEELLGLDAIGFFDNIEDEEDEEDEEDYNYGIYDLSSDENDE